MRRTYNYIFPIIIGTALIISVFIGYGVYEHGELSCGIIAPVGTSAFFAAEYVAELLLVRSRKYGFAIAVSVAKYLLLLLGLAFVFRQTFSRNFFFWILALVPGYNVVLFGWLLVVAPLLIICFLLMQVGIIVEPIMLGMEKKRLYVKPKNITCDDL